MDFENFKLGIMGITGLEKDALHIYVGISVYLLSLLLFRPIFRKYSIRAFMALIMVTGFALLGEYLDNRSTISELGVLGISSTQRGNSIHDLINTCFWPYMLYALTRWTNIFQPVTKPTGLLK
ncbi:hypothetical protein [Psychrobacter urativorans]|uniref:Uncharacterized protein n=1 Tax=Psychrobacter urativorans TaxID=45610 RepID=A0A0M4SXL8_9GAMM|nr:hypothetical protein [Psychrobacter urativorans]ALF59685.1 hypothetical protein AOC03_06275 [Psychrobacter urativorans]